MIKYVSFRPVNRGCLLLLITQSNLYPFTGLCCSALNCILLCGFLRWFVIAIFHYRFEMLLKTKTFKKVNINVFKKPIQRCCFRNANLPVLIFIYLIYLIFLIANDWKLIVLGAGISLSNCKFSLNYFVNNDNGYQNSFVINKQD